MTLAYSGEIAAKIEKLRRFHASGKADGSFKALLDQKLMIDATNPTGWAPVVINAETTGILVVGESGSGKTQTIRQGIARLAAFQGNGQIGTLPILSIKVPTPITIKSLLMEAVIKTGYHEISERRSASEIERILKWRMKRLGTTTLWIDEAQDLFKQKAGSGVEQTLAMIKSMMQGDYPVVVVLSGTKKLEAIAQIDQQVERRLSRIEVSPIEGQDAYEILGRALNMLCKSMDLTPNLAEDIVPRIVYASYHQLGRSFQTIRNSIECALQKESKCLEMEHFYEVYYRQNGCRADENIFHRKDWTMISLSRPEVTVTSLGRARRSA